jgi:hypothetical protein
MRNYPCKAISWAHSENAIEQWQPRGQRTDIPAAGLPLIVGENTGPEAEQAAVTAALRSVRVQAIFARVTHLGVYEGVDDVHPKPSKAGIYGKSEGVEGF